MTIIGFLFGFSSNVTPIVFLATLVVYIVCHDNFAKDQKIIKTRFWESSLFFAIIGIFIAIVLMYGFGPGVGSYTTGYNSSYVSISSLLQTPAIGFTNLISNLVHNFKDVAAIVIIMYLSLLVELIISKKRLMKNSNISSFGVKFSAICLVFFVIHVLIVSQINTTGMTRILIPAYIATIVSIVLTISRMIEILSISRRMIFYIASLLIIITSVITIDIGIVMFKHSAQAKTVLERIRLEPGSRVCVTPADNPSAKSPLLKYYQREIFTDWTMPATVYDKQVDWCV